MFKHDFMEKRSHERCRAAVRFHLDTSMQMRARKIGAGAMVWDQMKRKNGLHIKEKTTCSRASDKFGVNPVAGDVIDPNGESTGNLNDKWAPK
jgi:hypothetical protein